MNLTEALAAFAQADEVVMGYNPENADYTNPRGAIYGFSAYVFVEALDGSRWVHPARFTRRFEQDALEAASKFVDRVNKRLAEGGELNPDYWRETRPCYGSDAYIKNGWSQQDAYDELQADATFYDR